MTKVRSAVPVLALCALACLLSGCGGSSGLSVSGKVKVGTTPLKSGTVSLHPDLGNSDGKLVSGEIDSSGTYTIENVPPGSYKVTVVSELPKPQGADEYAPPIYAVADSVMEPGTTILKLEVKEGGKYDLDVPPR